MKKVGLEPALKGGGESLLSRGKPFQVAGARQLKDLLPNSV